MKTHTLIFNDGKSMDDYIKMYLKEYAPAGYDTQVEIKLEQSYEEWKENIIKYLVTFTRLDSCD